MSAIGEHMPTRESIPHLNACIASCFTTRLPASRHDALAIGRPGDGEDGASVPAIGEVMSPRGSIPDLHRGIRTCRSNGGAIG